MDNCFRWLHLTDFHWGTQDNKKFWGHVAPAFYKSLKELKKQCGGDLDVVFFTGDLVQSGKKNEFEGLDPILKDIKDNLGCDPVFICVPGNHDLDRPKKDDSKCIAMKTSWFTDLLKDVWDESKKAKNQYRKAIEKYFKHYHEWLNRQNHGFRKPDPTKFKSGLISGDFSYTFEKEGSNFKVGIVGLNSAFLQITEGDFEGKLDLGVDQINAVCSEMPDNWINKHDMSILLTHHPREWFSEYSDFKWIAQTGRFDLHLCGHVHLNDISFYRPGASSESVRTAQSRALFSKEKFEDYKKGITIEERFHGYSVGRVEFKENEIELRFWPQKGKMNERSGKFSFKKDDDDIDLLQDGGTEPEIIQYKKANIDNDGTQNDSENSNNSNAKEKGEVIDFILTNLRHVFADTKMQDFFDILYGILAIPDPDKDPKKAIRSLLISSKSGFTVSKLTEAIIRYLDIYPDSSDKKHVWENVSEIVCWAVLAEVDHNELIKHKEAFKNSKNFQIILPVSKASSSEILFSAINKVKPEFSLRKVKRPDDYEFETIAGKKHFRCNTDIEYGLTNQDNLKKFMDQLWEKVFGIGEKKDLPREYFDDHFEKLNRRLRTKADRNELTYLLFDLADIQKDDHNYRAILKLKERLPNLHLILMHLNGNDCLVIPNEEDLEDKLIDFLRQKQRVVDDK